MNELYKQEFLSLKHLNEHIKLLLIHVIVIDYLYMKK